MRSISCISGLFQAHPVKKSSLLLAYANKSDEVLLFRYDISMGSTNQDKIIRAGVIICDIMDFGLKCIPLYTGGGAFRGIKSLYTILEEMDPKTRYRYHKQIDRLVTDGYIILGGEKIELTKKGKQFVKDRRFYDLQLQPKKWDGKWHIVSYDVPNFKSKARDHLRLTLKRWGFYKIHKSTWVIATECKEEIAILAQELGIAPYVLYLNATDLPMAEKLNKLFGLSTFIRIRE